MNDRRTPFVAAEANVRAANVKRASRAGRSHNEWRFSNRMLDTAVALVNAK